MRLLIALLSVAVLSQAQQAKTINDVHVIFVDSLGPENTSSMIRDKIINRLTASKRFQVSLDPAKADAILSGSAEVTRGVRFTDEGGGTRYDGTAAIRLITPDKTILWTYETKSNGFARSASSSVADHIVKELEKAATPKRK